MGSVVLVAAAAVVVVVAAAAVAVAVAFALAFAFAFAFAFVLPVAAPAAVGYIEPGVLALEIEDARDQKLGCVAVVQPGVSLEESEP